MYVLGVFFAFFLYMKKVTIIDYRHVNIKITRKWVAPENIELSINERVIEWY